MHICIEKMTITDSEHFVFVERSDGCTDDGRWITGTHVGAQQDVVSVCFRSFTVLNFHKLKIRILQCHLGAIRSRIRYWYCFQFQFYLCQIADERFFVVYIGVIYKVGHFEIHPCIVISELLSQVSKEAIDIVYCGPCVVASLNYVYNVNFTTRCKKTF